MQPTVGSSQLSITKANPDRAKSPVNQSFGGVMTTVAEKTVPTRYQILRVHDSDLKGLYDVGWSYVEPDEMPGFSIIAWQSDKAVSTLDYFDAAIAEDHAKAPAAPAGPQIVSIQEFIVEGTLEWSAWNLHLRETTGRGSPVTDNRDEHGRIRRGWFRPTVFPPGYDEATGEKLPPSAEDAA
jgi:hypothetical protein